MRRSRHCYTDDDDAHRLCCGREAKRRHIAPPPVFSFWNELLPEMQDEICVRMTPSSRALLAKTCHRERDVSLIEYSTAAGADHTKECLCTLTVALLLEGLHGLLPRLGLRLEEDQMVSNYPHELLHQVIVEGHCETILYLLETYRRLSDDGDSKFDEGRAEECCVKRALEFGNWQMAEMIAREDALVGLPLHFPDSLLFAIDDMEDIQLYINYVTAMGYKYPPEWANYKLALTRRREVDQVTVHRDLFDRLRAFAQKKEPL